MLRIANTKRQCSWSNQIIEYGLKCGAWPADFHVLSNLCAPHCLMSYFFMHLVHLRHIISENPKDLRKQRMWRWTMTIQEAIRLFNNYLESDHKQRTIDSYDHLLIRFERIYAERTWDSVGPDEIYTFLGTLTQDLAKSTRRLRYAQLKAFYNFIIDRCSLNMKNPCNTSLLRKS